MNIVSLDVSNIMRISAAFITAEDAPVVIIGGKNGHGKSSCLDAIAMAIGGKKLCPPEPLRRGKAEGHVTVNLGAYLVTRRFWRTAADEIASSLTVSSPEGAEFRSPQALLDKLVTDLTFDPLAFLDLAPKDQREYVRKFVGLDFKALDAQRSAALEAVRECETVLKVAEHDVKAGEYYEGAPTDLVDADALLAALAEAEALERAAVDAEQAVEKKRTEVASVADTIARQQEAIAALKQQIADREAMIAEAEQRQKDIVAAGKQARADADAARARVPDTSVIRQQLAEANTVNARVQANRRHAALLDARDSAKADVAEARARIATIDAEKQRQLNAAAFPVPGLSFGDDGLMYDGLPFEQASYAQQLRVAVAMGLASNPELKVLLIKHGNALDSDSLRLLTDLAAERGAQVWLERVAESKDGVSVLIEDGRVVAVDGEPAAAQVCSGCGVEYVGGRACACAAEQVPA